MARLRAPAVAVLVAAGLLAGSIVSPAFGGPSLGSLKRAVAQSLRLARAADKRSRQALVAAKTGKPGPPGPPGSIGPTGGATAGGGSAVPVDFRAAAGATQVVYSRGGLVLTAACTTGPNLDVKATTTVNDSALHLSVVTHSPKTASTSTLYREKNDFLTTTNPISITKFSDGSALATGGHLEGSLTYTTPTGTITSLTFAAEQGAFGGAAAKDCWFGGMAETNAP